MNTTYSPLVSVIVPNYNHAQYLETRFNSILAQDYQNIEIIILDDNSTDDSLKIINKYKNNPLVSQLITSENNSGSTFKQWEKGIKQAKGDIIWIAESDDSCSPHLLSKLIEKYYKENAVLAFCRSSLIDELGNVASTRFQNCFNGSFSMDGKQFIKNYLAYGNPIYNTSSVIFDKKAVLSINNSYTFLKGSGDRLLWILLSEKGNVSFLDENHNYFRIHGNNTTTSLNKRGINIKESKYIFDYMISQKLISLEQSRQIRKNKLWYILQQKFEDKNLEKKLLKLWGADYKFYTKLFLLKIYYKLLRIKNVKI